MTLPRLQLHLSTLLAVMLLATGLVWLNSQRTEIPMWDDPPESGGRLQWIGSKFGWPVPFYEDVYCGCEGGPWDFGALMFDLVVTTSLLGVVAIASEFTIRRRANP